MKSKINPIEKILIDKEEIAEICKRLGEQISDDYKGKKLCVVGVLKGSLPFTADLIREIDCDIILDFLQVSSYVGTETSGFINIKKDLDTDIEGLDVIIIEDILESGTTLSYVEKLLLERNPASVSICTLLDKPERRKTPINAKYVGKTISNEFVIGYGLDYNEDYRNLPFVAILNPAIYTDTEEGAKS